MGLVFWRKPDKSSLTHLVPELGAGLGHESGVNPGVQAAAGVDAERVALLRTGAPQHGDQPVHCHVKIYTWLLTYAFIIIHWHNLDSCGRK